MSGTESVQESIEDKSVTISANEGACCGASDQIIAVREGEEVRDKVQEYYANRARSTDACCGDASQNLLYESDLLTELPEDVANFTLGCGDPITLAQLQHGEVVLDLGSGGVREFWLDYLGAFWIRG